MNILDKLINDYSTSNLISFLRGAIPSFKPDEEELDHLFQENLYEKYEAIVKIGEAEIDIMVYKLYKLSYQEVKIIDPEFPLTQEEYENYQIDE